MKSFQSQGLAALSLAFLSLTSLASARSIRRDAPYLAPNATVPCNGTNTTVANGTSVAPPPMETPTLLPAVHWEYPVDDIRNLAPLNSTDLYYSHGGVSDPEVQHMFAQLSASLQYDAVVLDHSSYVSNVSCSADGILVNFASPEGYNFASTSWVDNSNFVLVTYTDGCGASSDQRTFWLIDDLDFHQETNSILAVVKEEIGIENALHTVNLVWGTYHPPQANATSTNSSIASRSFGEFNPEVSKAADISLFPPADSSAPWPNAFKVFSDSGSKGNASATIDLYCVDCGVKGHVSVDGSAKFSIFHGLEALNAHLQANIQAGLKVGIDATASFSDKKTKNLINQAIPDLGFSVAKVFSAGVFITVDATAELDIDAEAEILAGVTMNLPNFDAQLNLIDEDSAGKSQVTGYQPTWDKTFEAKGSVSATATIALPIGLNLGIEISPISWKKSVALIEQPSLVGKVTAAGSIGGSAASDTCNDGVEYSVNAVNDISLNIFDLKTVSLEHYESPDLIHGCYQVPGAKKTTTTSAASTTTSAPVKSNLPSHNATATGPSVSGRPTGYGNQTVFPTGSGVRGTGIGGRPTGTGVSGRPIGTGVTGRPVGTGVSGRPTYGSGNSTIHPTGTGFRSTVSGGRPTTAANASLTVPSYGGSDSSSTVSTLSTKISSTASYGFSNSANATSAISTRPAAISSAESTTTTEATPSSYGAPLPYGATTTTEAAKTTTTSSSSSSTCTDEEKTSTKTSSSTSAEVTTTTSAKESSTSTSAAPTTTSEAKTTSTSTSSSSTSTTTMATSTKVEATSTSKASKPTSSAGAATYGSE